MNLTSAKNIDMQLLQEIFSLAETLEEKKTNNELKGKVLCNLFFEPSTRTRISFESAISRLGGSAITLENFNNLAITRGESFKDTINVLDKFVDAIVLRHPSEELIFDLKTNSALINAGNGGDEHPTQALLDLYTIKKELGRIDNFKILFVGDLLYGRTIHSLIYLISKLSKIDIYFASPKELELPIKYKEDLKKHNINFFEIEDWKKILQDIDVLYINRIKKEKFTDEESYEEVRSLFCIDQLVLNLLNKKAIIMHPLPRTEEIPDFVDNDKRAVYFKQAENGLYIRMALLSLILK